MVKCGQFHTINATSFTEQDALFNVTPLDATGTDPAVDQFDGDDDEPILLP